MSAKAEILARIGRAGAAHQSPLERPRLETSRRSREEIVDQFAEYAAEYKAHVVRVSPAELPEAVRSLLAAQGNERVLLPPDLPAEWLPSNLPAQRDEKLDHRALDQFQAVVTGCAVAIAETGTVVLDAGPAQGRRALTLVPDHHICIVFEHQVVDTVPEAVATLRESVLNGQPLTWISGPSATSDIELSRVEGVHGPRKLDIILVSK
jgi:L-lactate dehydrogenase complex protein LldG